MVVAKDNEASADRDHGETTKLDVSAIARERGQAEQRMPVLTVLYGNQMGQTLICKGKTLVIGRARKCHLFCSDSGVSREHVAIDRRPEGGWAVRDLGSTNGTYLNGQKVRAATLNDGDSLHLGPIAVIGFSYESRVEYELRVRQYEHSTRDELTGIHNRRYLALALKSEVAYALRYGDELSLVMFDIDRFKLINDTYGHHAGDEIIRQLTRAVSGQLRKEDVFARYGGEEFTVLLRGLDGRQAHEFCERLRQLVEGLQFPVDGRTLAVTISLGLATMDGNHRSLPEAMTEAADRCLYQAKAGGRNMTVGPEPVP